MYFKEFLIAELEEQLDGIELIEAKIEFVSDEILKCERVIQELQFGSEIIDTKEIKFAIKQSGCNTSLIELLNKDSEIRNAVTKRILKTCKEKLCERNEHFLQRAKSLKDNLQTKFELQVKCQGLQSAVPDTQVLTDKTERIVWFLGKNKLLEMFESLNANEIIPKYSREEILTHFSDEKQNPFRRGYNHHPKIQWRDSDSSFSIFVDELARRGAIDEKRKYQIFEKHFKNNNGKSFKNLPQKKNYTKNFTQSGNLIVTILDSIKLSATIIFCISYWVEVFLEGYISGTLSYFI
ncbi:MAG: hypothetical protein M1495_16300 [Bacteroidetes bacterium]|nr:hypothetical protein [Bacteroidota bacterium]